MRLELRKIHKYFGEHHVLKGISLAAESGRAFGLLGRNGAGKTTSIRILMDVIRADQGEIVLDNQPFRRQAGQIGYLPEEKGLYPKLQILHQMIYIGELRGLSHAAAKRRAELLLDRLAMSQHAKKRLETLSKGNQQKIQLAVALITDPQIVILDEPFSGLDPVNAQLLKDLVREQVEAGKIVFFSSHQMSYVESFCDDLAILHNGEIVLAGTIFDLKNAYPENRLACEFFKNGLRLNCAESNQILSAAQATGHLPPGLALRALKDERCELTLPDQYRPESCLRDLLALGLDLKHFALIRPELEDIFIEYTGQGDGLENPAPHDLKQGQDPISLPEMESTQGQVPPKSDSCTKKQFLSKNSDPTKESLSSHDSQEEA